MATLPSGHGVPLGYGRVAPPGSQPWHGDDWVPSPGDCLCIFILSIYGDPRMRSNTSLP
jgi:hypothetical protein